MKRTLTASLALCMAAGAFPQAKQIPYTSALCADADWQTVNVTEGTSTWADEDDPYYFKGSGFECGKFYKYDRNNPADDWLISPALSLEAGKEYKISLWVDAGETENMELRMARASDVASLSVEGTQVADYVFDSYDMTRHALVVTPAETGDWYFGIHAYSEADRNKIYVTGFEVKENVFMPGAPTGLTVTPDVDGAVSAEISWTLPTRDSDGAPLPESAVFDSVRLFRDGTLIATLGGDAVTYTDTEAGGLTAGKHLYSVCVTVNGVTGPEAEVTSRHIGPLGTYALPWTAGVGSLTADEFATLFTIIRGEGSELSSSKGWSLKSGYIRFYPGKYDAQDDWLILPKVRFEQPGIYRLKVNAEFNNSNDVLIEVYRGQSRSIAAMTEKLGAFTRLPETKADTEVTFEVAEPGEYHLALRAADSDPEYSAYIKLFEITIEEGELLPLPVTGLTAVVEDSSVRLRWTNPAVYNTGKAIERIDRIDVVRGETVIASISENIVPGAGMEYVDGPGLSGVYTYSLVPYVGELTPKDAPMTVTTPWVGDRIQTLPYVLNFEDAAVSSVVGSLWTVRNNDNDSYLWTLTSTGFTLGVDDWDGGSHDDMLVSPPFMLSPGQYELTLDLSGGESGYPLLVGVVEDGDGTYTLQTEQTVALDGGKTVSGHTVTLAVGAEPEALRAMQPEARRYCFAIHAASVYDYNARQIKLAGFKAVYSGDPNAVDEIGLDDTEAGFTYYDLTGRRVERPVKGVYIRVNAFGVRGKVML